MSNIIKELKYEHMMIYRLLSGLRDLDGGPEEVRKLLLSAKKRIMEHVRKEDARLYPALRKAAGRDKALLEKLDQLAGDMSDTTAELEKFFIKYSKSGPRGNFVEDLNSLYTLIKERLQKEEMYLFPEYSAITGKR